MLDVVQADPARPWTTAQMAEVAGMSVRRLQEDIPEHVGVTPGEYLRDLRLDRSRLVAPILRDAARRAVRMH